ncbi:MAG: hypothetical protein K6L75_03175 [Cellvibrionaceae bacterium]|nr:organomercurial lyase [Motiliproteus sp.]MCW9052170.1 organomercurial lyase [Motiliproteus sp.]
MTEYSQPPQALADALLSQLPTLSLEEQKVSLAIYRLLAEGEPVSQERLAKAVVMPVNHLQHMLEDWTGIYFDEAQQITGYWGLSLKPTPHKMQVKGVYLYAWCAWDTLFIPEILGETVEVESLAPGEQSTIQLHVSPGLVEAVSPQEAVLSFMLPDKKSLEQDVICNFCHYVHFFPSTEKAEDWIRDYPRTFVISLDEGSHIARLKNESQYAGTLTAY